jgi:hypothetical protein
MVPKEFLASGILYKPAMRKKILPAKLSPSYAELTGECFGHTCPGKFSFDILGM